MNNKSSLHLNVIKWRESSLIIGNKDISGQIYIWILTVGERGLFQSKRLKWLQNFFTPWRPFWSLEDRGIKHNHQFHENISKMLQQHTHAMFDVEFFFCHFYTVIGLAFLLLCLFSKNQLYIFPPSKLRKTRNRINDIEKEASFVVCRHLL